MIVQTWLRKYLLEQRFVLVLLILPLAQKFTEFEREHKGTFVLGDVTVRARVREVLDKCVKSSGIQPPPSQCTITSLY